MTPDDLGGFVTLSDPQLHPDGVRIAFVVSRMDLDQDRYERSIWVWDGRAARAFTHGPADTRPRWSPDGGRLGFLRASGEPGKPAQVAVMGATGGEAGIVTSFGLGVTEAEWSPDGAHLGVVGSEWLESDVTEEERKRRPRRLREAGYRFDNLGWLHDRRRNVYLVDPAGGDPVALTTGDQRDTGVTWRPDGAAVGFIGSRHERRYVEPGNQAWEVAIDGGEPRALVAIGAWGDISYRADGVVHLVGHPDPWGYPRVAGVWRLEPSGPVRLAQDLDRNFAVPSGVFPPGPQWLADGRFRSAVEDRGGVRIVEVARDGTWTDVAGGERVITGMTTRNDGSAMAFTATRGTDPGELVWWEDGVESVLTDMNAASRDGGGLVPAEHFVVERDGVDLDAWVLLPPGTDRVPLLLNIHGGPATQYGFGFFDEFQIYAGAGFGVLACNPRGSSGRGTEFVRVPVARWTEERPPDLEDILAVVAAALDRYPRLDEDRMGIMGGSYGGFMTARILSVDHRWKSAVAERGLYSFTSFTGTSDIGYEFPRNYLATVGWDWETLWAASPLSRADRITTPCLLVHSEEDYRCPIEQAEQLFAILLHQGVEVEMLRFPGSSHELSRSGKPKYRRERFEAILSWHRRHLGVST
jgi:dipeptidyl aminopeptidase/acylaminoacyl peptidase